MSFWIGLLFGLAYGALFGLIVGSMVGAWWGYRVVTKGLDDDWKHIAPSQWDHR